MLNISQNYTRPVKIIVNQNSDMLKCENYELIATYFATIHGEKSFSDNVVDLFIEIERKYYDTSIMNMYKIFSGIHHSDNKNW